MPAAVLFDLDGTLADTAPDLYTAASTALADLQMPPVPFKEARDYIGDGMPRFIKRLVTRQWWGEPPTGLYQRMHERLSHHYQQGCVNSSLYAHVPAVLAQLGERAVKMACVTNKAERYTLPLLRTCGVLKHFSSVVCGDTLPVKKPDPAPLFSAMETLQVSAADTVMVGDSLADSRAAAAAGCKFICMRHGYHRQNKLPPATAYAESFAEVIGLLDAL